MRQGSRPALPVLCRALTDSDAKVRRTAAEAAGVPRSRVGRCYRPAPRHSTTRSEDVRLAFDKALLRIVRISH